MRSELQAAFPVFDVFIRFLCTLSTCCCWLLPLQARQTDSAAWADNLNIHYVSCGQTFATAAAAGGAAVEGAAATTTTNSSALQTSLAVEGLPAAGSAATASIAGDAATASTLATATSAEAAAAPAAAISGAAAAAAFNVNVDKVVMFCAAALALVLV